MPGFWALILPHLSKSDRDLIKKCFLHQAEWGVSSPRSLEPWDGHTVWQFTDKGSCPGVSGPCDMNRSVAAEGKVLALGKRSDRPEPEPEPDRRTEPEPEPDRPDGVPNWVPREYWEHFQKPWDEKAANSSKFRELCWKNGLASPHFERKETDCNDARSTPVPDGLRPNAQRQAFNLERLRHELGDKPLAILSWFRTPAHNAAVDGASQSRHMQADATDFTTQTVNDFGASKFDAACEKIYSNGGFGRYPSGSRHTDSRGSRARW